MKLHPKQKLYFILVSGVVLFLLSYKLAFNKTFEARNSYLQLLTQSEFTKDLPGKLALLQQKNEYYDSVLNKMNIGGTSVQNNIIKFLNEGSNQRPFKIVELKKPHIAEQEDHKSTIYQFKLQGQYTTILKTIHDLEQNGNFGEVVHVDLEKKRNYRTKRERLEATIFIKQLQ